MIIPPDVALGLIDVVQLVIMLYVAAQVRKSDG